MRIIVPSVLTYLRRVRGSIRSPAFEREMAEEFRLHIELEAEALATRGMDRRAALAEARRRFGSVAFAEDACRDSWGLRLFDALGQDARYATRIVARYRGYSAIVVLTLALGIGANTAIFSVVHAVLLRSLPYASGDRLVEIRQELPGRGVANIGLSAREIDDYRARSASLDAVVEYHQMWFTLLDGATPTRVVTGVVSSGFFDVLGVAPILGRGFREADERDGAPAVLLLSYEYWKRAFDGDPGVVGRAFQMNDRAHTVIGVLPAVPQYPAYNDVYMPASACPFRSAPNMAADRAMRMVSAIARVKPGITVGAARAELAMIGRRLSAAYPDAYDAAGGFAVTAVSVREQLTAQARPLLLLLIASTAFVLVLVCANVANLMVARLAGRDRELSLRTALGAGQPRLIRQLLTESTLLALAGGIGGVLLAVLARDLLIAFIARFSLRAAEISIDRTVLSFAFGLSVATGLLFGVVPVLTLGGTPRVLPARRLRVRQLLIGVQVAIAVVLLIASGLTVRSFVNLRAIDGGFDANRVLTATVDLDWVKYDTAPARREYFRALLDRLQREIGVETAALSLTFPLNGSTPFSVPVMTDNAPAPPHEGTADLRLASPDYFRTIGMTLLGGRTFTNRDQAGARPVAIVNLSFARHQFGGANPIGRRITVDGGATWWRIVGLVNDVKQYGLASAPSDEVYVPFDQRAPLSATVLVRTAGEPAAMWRAVQRLAYDLDPRQPISRPQTLEQVRNAAIASPRATATLLTLLAALALVITAVGIAGVVSFFVAQRTAEIGVRRALGAPRWCVVWLVVGEAVMPVAAGLAGGLVFAAVAMRAVLVQLFEVRHTDPAVYVTVFAVLVCIAALACLVPARRAAAIEPAVALRGE